MEWFTLGLFCAGLMFCLAIDQSILFALAFGLLLFLLYGRKKGFSWQQLLQMALEGVKTVKNILITFLLIGILTALWRAGGTIPAIVCYASALIRPSVFLLMTFLLNSCVSVLTGTSFGTAATMGVICATMGTVMGIDLRLSGGAVLAGAFFGDRCSPVSTSALLVAGLTQTDIFDNIRRMLRTGLVPFLVSCLIYTVLGMFTAHTEETMDLWELFRSEFVLHWVLLLPPCVILLLSALRVNVKKAMIASILSAIPLCVLVQHLSLAQLLHIVIFGFQAADESLEPMINGGGILSMIRVAGIVCLSSSYSGIFQKTGLLDNARQAIEHFAGKTSSFAAVLLTSVLTGMIACNQTLTVMLTHQLCEKLEKDASNFANTLEDSAIVVAPLVPWSIAGGVPLSAVGAPSSAILFAFYLYLLPVWRLLFAKKKD